MCANIYVHIRFSEMYLAASGACWRGRIHSDTGRKGLREHAYLPIIESTKATVKIPISKQESVSIATRLCTAFCA